MTMNDSSINDMEALVQQTDQALSGVSSILEAVLADADNLDMSDVPPEFQIHTLQYILQFRLDMQNVLSRLVNLEQTLLQVLGIGPQYSATANLERLAFALGNEDLHQLLYALNELVSSLLKIAYRYRKNHEHTSKTAHRVSTGYKTFSRGLQKASDQQKKALALLEKLGNRLGELNKRAAIGPIFDHIAALRGPVSQFFQAIQHGMTLSAQLYQKMNAGKQFDHQLSKILKQAEQVLQQIPAAVSHHQLFTPVKAHTNERLEKRAAEKRLGHFFGH
ncbi:hypothetical protein [Legionella spiritensis]|uniref:Uncharacterized protein n=2 Tax=Legionella spiritensis TaxID=452 RepID=A0A0W0Z8P6_LEGSP|nr:hypothetical protein [Legionella spiritensis]KTD65490.1 hypothetical protein Lspi_0564 [Legionella spiritensis]SNV35900.1 Uncharacterised protein [Legionella spiritensis]